MSNSAVMIRKPRRYRRILAIFIGLVALSCVVFFVLRQKSTTTLRIATGQKGGTFLPLGEELAANINRQVPRVKASAIESTGSPYSVELLEGKKVELALVSNNTDSGEHVRLIAPLYPETLQVIVRTPANVTNPRDLAGKKVAIGPSASGTETIAWQVLDHFGVGRNAKAHGAVPAIALNLTPMEAAARIESGEIDAVFVVAGLRAPVVERLLAREDMQLLSLGSADKAGGSLDGIHVDAPYLLPSVIPERTYGDKPAEPVGTMGVKALLVVRDDIDEDIVFEITQSLFANKLRLAQKEKLLSHLSEKFDPGDSPYPLHPGADRYLRRNQPSVIEQNVDVISLLITVAAIVWSGVTAVHAWRKRSQKGRIEHYYADLADLTKRVRKATTNDELDEVLLELNKTEAKALTELASERLEPDQSFRVLQEALRTLEDDVVRTRGAIIKASA